MEVESYQQGELIYYSFNLSPEFTDIVLVPISDTHKGHPLYSEKHFNRTIDYIARTPNAVAVLNGDLIEAVTRDSIGDIFRQQGTAQKQAKDIIKLLEPIKDKILGVTMGNHEQRVYKTTGIDICADIAERLNSPYRPSGMLMKISFGRGNGHHVDKPYVFWVYMTHGYGGARTKAAKAVKGERVATYIDADVYLVSHDHVVNVAPDVYLKPDPRTRLELDDGKETGFTVGRVTAHRKMIVKTNAYLKWGDYSEMGGFPPVDMTTPLIHLLIPSSPQWQSYPEKPHQGVKVTV